MKTIKYSTLILATLVMFSCKQKKEDALKVEVYETSESGNKLTQITEFSKSENMVQIKLLPEEKLQTITGFGGAFTESSAYLLNKLSIFSTGSSNIPVLLPRYFLIT